MIESLRPMLLRLLRVPSAPEPPAGGDLQIFRAAPAYFRYKLMLWGIGQVGALVGLVASLVGLHFLLQVVDNRLVTFLLQGAEALAWVTFLVQLPFSLALLRLDFQLRWYMLSDRSLRIREGILRVREKTMTFANIQQISIRQNPIQRALGLADVQVRTAGGGSAGGSHGQAPGESMHEGFFRGVNNASEIKRAIQERVRLYRDAGLGDPDEPPPRLREGESPEGREALLAARRLLEELRELRRELELAGDPAEARGPWSRHAGKQPDEGRTPDATRRPRS